MRRVLVAVALLATVFLPAPEATARQLTILDAPVKILTLGDSITSTGAWQATLCELMAANAGRSCEIDNPSVGGSSCNHWPSRIAGLLTQYRPDVVTMNCGTNEDVNGTAYGEPVTSWSWRYTVEAVHAFNPAIVIVPSFIQYSDPLIAPDWLLTSEPVTNDRIYAEIMRHQSWFSAFANMQPIPATATYLDGGGIHPTARGYAYMGRIEYDAIRVGMGWPAATGTPLCDLYGHRGGYARPAYTPCGGG